MMGRESEVRRQDKTVFILSPDFRLPTPSFHHLLQGRVADLTASNEERACAARRAPFQEALGEALARRGIDPEAFCPADDLVARRVLEEYGAMFVAAESVSVPAVCIFTNEEELLAFQCRAGWRAADF